MRFEAPFRLSRQTAIMAVFFLQAFSGAGLYTRIPDIQTKLGMSESALGVTLMGQPIGALIVFIIASRVVEAVGPRRILIFGLALLASWTFLLGLAPSQLIATLLFGMFGATFALTNVAMNVEADRVEAATDEKVMNRCHGLWSLGFLTASLFGAGARGMSWGPALHFGLILPLVILAILLILVPFVPAPARAHTGAKSRKITLPTGPILLLVGFGLAAVMIENGTRAWAVIFMRDSFNAPDWVDTMALPAFVAAMFLTRMSGDKIVTKFGRMNAAYLLLSIAFIGACVVVFAQSLWMAMFGFAMLGIGISIIFPMTLSAAAQIGDRPASENVAALTLGTSVIMLAAPGIMGFVADSFSVRISFALFVPLLLTSLALTRRVQS